jgi:hypothetical protein
MGRSLGAGRRINRTWHWQPSAPADTIVGMRILAGVALAALLGATPARAQPRLVEVADLVGVRHTAQTENALVGAGVAIFDYDRDGRPDLLFVDDGGPCRLYRNEAGGAIGLFFRDVTEETRLFSLCRGLAVAVLDYDRDGWDDLAIGSARGVTLLRNGAGTFADRTGPAGLGGERAAAVLAAADVDGDGFPDLYVGRYVTAPRFPVHGCGANRLWRNRGDGTFEDVAASLGVDDAGCALAATLLDLDGDGDLDLVVANDFGTLVRPNEIYRNDAGRFTAVGAAWGAALRIYAMGIAVGDVDGDGHLDLYFTNIGRNVLLRGVGPGFADATEAAGVGLATVVEGGAVRWRSSWGTALVDLDLDGWDDLYVASGHILAEPPIANARYQPNALLAGAAGGFAPVPGEGDDARNSRAVAVGDLDGDGAPDVVVSNILLRAPDAPEPRPAIYLSAPPAGRAFLGVRLEGTVSDRRAAGARVFVTSHGRTQTRVVDAGGASHGSHHDATLLFGLGDATAPVAVRVHWPSGAATSHLFAPGAVHLVREPRWLRVPPRVAAGSVADLEVEPLDGEGAPLGPGRSVLFAATRGEIAGAAADLGDGRYRQAFRAPDEPGPVRIQVTVDGAPLSARPLVRVVAGDETTTAVPEAPARAGETVQVHVVPRDSAGVPLGPGRAVVLVPSSGSAGTAEDLGDGTYRIPFTAPAPGTVTLAVEVDGVRQASATSLAVVTPFDPARSSVEVLYALAAPGDRVLLRARVVDGAGRPSPAVADLSFAASSGTIEGRPQSFATGFATQWLALPDAAPEKVTVRATVAGEPMARDAIVRVLPGGSPAPRDLLDPISSGPLAFHTAIPADGRSTVRVLAAVRDVNGGFLTATPGTVFTTSAGTWRGPATAGLGNLATRCLVAPEAPGVAEVRLSVSGVPMAGRALIAFHAARPGEPAQDGCGLDEGPEVPESLPGAEPPLDGGAAAPDAGVGGNGGGTPDAGGVAAPPPSARGSGCATTGTPETGLLALALAVAFRRPRPRRGHSTFA